MIRQSSDADYDRYLYSAGKSPPPTLMVRAALRTTWKETRFRRLDPSQKRTHLSTMGVSAQRIEKTFLSREPNRAGKWSAALWFLLLCLTSAIYWTNFKGWSELLPATRAQTLEQGQYWRLLTSMGVHADGKHLFANGFLFTILAFLLRGHFGWSAFPAVAVIGGVLTTALSLATYPPDIQLIGASGMVYFMASFWLVLYFGIERRRTPIRRLVNCIAFTLVVLIPSQMEPQVSYRAHAIGYGVGLVLGALYFFRYRKAFRRAEVLTPPSGEELTNVVGNELDDPSFRSEPDPSMHVL